MVRYVNFSFFSVKSQFFKETNTCILHFESSYQHWVNTSKYLCVGFLKGNLITFFSLFLLHMGQDVLVFHGDTREHSVMFSSPVVSSHIQQDLEIYPCMCLAVWAVANRRWWGWGTFHSHVFLRNDSLVTILLSALILFVYLHWFCFFYRAVHRGFIPSHLVYCLFLSWVWLSILASY